MSQQIRKHESSESRGKWRSKAPEVVVVLLAGDYHTRKQLKDVFRCTPGRTLYTKKSSRHVKKEGKNISEIYIRDESEPRRFHHKKSRVFKVK